MQDVYRPNPKRKTRKQRRLLLIVFFVGVTVGTLFLLQEKTTRENHTYTTNPVEQSSPPKKGILKILTGPQFRDLYNSFAYPNTQRINEETPITGNPDADAHIRAVAEKRGYLVRSAPVTDTFITIAPGMRLQERATQPWLDMQAAAKNDGQQLMLTAAYRSAEEQKSILLDRFAKAGLGPTQLALNATDSQINQILRTTAVPGYSRHHTGYTIDIGCENDPAVIFDVSSCFRWLSADNYKNAKRFGWIPSYPPGAGEQGPDPESWEYVWVGTDALTD